MANINDNNILPPKLNWHLSIFSVLNKRMVIHSNIQIPEVATW